MQAGGRMPVGTNKRYSHHYDKLTEQRIIERFVATAGPLQTLSPEELELDRCPVTVYPEDHRPKVKAWVRFGPQHTRVDALLCRSTQLAAGIEFVVRDKTYKCWVWGNAVTMADASD